MQLLVKSAHLPFGRLGSTVLVQLNSYQLGQIKTLRPEIITAIPSPRLGTRYLIRAELSPQFSHLEISMNCFADLLIEVDDQSCCQVVQFDTKRFDVQKEQRMAVFPRTHCQKARD